MIAAITGKDAAAKLNTAVPECVVEFGDDYVVVMADKVDAAAKVLRDDKDLNFEFLANQTAVDYYDYFEVVYHLISYKKHLSLTLKARVYDREHPEIPSVYKIWQGADFQERETYDLMGISFTGHPNMRRIFLWDGFQGHPLRKDYLGPQE